MTTSPAIPADSATAPEDAGTSRTPRKWWKFWKLPIGVQSLIAVGVGALIGTFAPAVGEQLKLAGDVFLNLVQMIVVPLVFPLIVLGIARMDSAKKVGRMAAKAILYFEIVTTIILLMAVALAKLLDIGSGAPVAGADEASVETLEQGIDFHELLLHAVPKNVFAAFAEANLLAVIVFAGFVGVALAAIGEQSKPMTAVLDSLANAMFKVVGYVIRLAPLGVLGFISYDVAHYGFGNLSSLLGFLAVVYVGMAIILGIIFPIIAAIFRVEYVTMLKAIGNLVGLAFVTRSSEAVLAPLLLKLEGLGVSRSTTSFVVPLGYSFNTDGSVLYQAVALVFLANAYGVDTSIPTLLLMVGVLVILSKGMAGVASASIVVLIAAGNTIGLPAEAVALLLGVDFIADMARTAVNVVGNSLAATVIDKSEEKAEAKAGRSAATPSSVPATAGGEPGDELGDTVLAGRRSADG
ncbi:dicarboxylate/amino acid:cation symporter [Rhodococcus sp. WB9]|uniref:dicarboxylate/amino acid:cation symporter n=1 Tax=Rhodococcus sp. WB9 TaxID=2594007 RepID=UPI0011855974|nr:dicarboxylate/amino acid:cation symporter [Rhodococcus sp. WB9]QDQ94994.1 dicarboxylate/amino acid:cation symporter [Rhodococcus sp. WB9]